MIKRKMDQKGWKKRPLSWASAKYLISLWKMDQKQNVEKKGLWGELQNDKFSLWILVQHVYVFVKFDSVCVC